MKGKRVAKQGMWRVYGVKHPMDFEGQAFRPRGRATLADGWFWIARSEQSSLYVRVHGLKAARALCRQLNGGASNGRGKARR